MQKKKATVHLSSLDRFVHFTGELEYVLARLPLVITAEAEYPRSYEVQVKEYLNIDVEPARFDVLVDAERPVPIAYEVLRSIALDFYCANRTHLSDRRGRSETVRVIPRTYSIELDEQA